ncbi:MAG: hypothetical protein DWQ19_12705 [Crenarchaeota archaeon]|nr:MAG: hypothetical protein DWQ19_12705 [Thermoproteota archaeon]
MASKIPFFTPEDFVGHTPPPTDETPPRKLGEKKYVRVGSIINWIMTGVIKPYEWNRGTGEVCAKIVQSVRKHGIVADAIGEATIGYPNPDSDQLYCSNSHSRIYSFVDRYLKGDMTSREINYTFSIRVVEDFLNSYIVCNTQGAHGAKDKIQSPDLTYGSVLHGEVFPLLSQEARARLGNNKWSILKTVLYALTVYDTADERWWFPTVYSSRTSAGKLENNLGGTLKTNTTIVRQFASSIESWNEFCDLLTASAGGLNVNKVVSSAGFFGFLVSDRLRKKPELPPNKKLIQRMLSHFSEVSNLCSSLTNGRKSEMIDRCGELTKILTTGRRYRNSLTKRAG